jgi:hypothetical protein
VPEKQGCLVFNVGLQCMKVEAYNRGPHTNLLILKLME